MMLAKEAIESLLPRSILLLVLVFAILIAHSNTYAQITYYSRSSGDWNDPAVWSTVSCGDPTNTGTFPNLFDNAVVCSSHTITINVNSNISNLTIQSGGAVLYTNSASRLLKIFTSLVNDGTFGYTSNAGITHALELSGSLTNNGIFDLFVDSNDGVNLNLNGGVPATVSGSGTFDIKNVLLAKNPYTTIIDITTAAFYTNLVANGGTWNHNSGFYIHNNSTSFNLLNTGNHTINENSTVEVRAGTISFASAASRLILEGRLIVSGGNVTVGSSTGAAPNGIKYSMATTRTPSLTVSSGTLSVFQGINYSSNSTHPFSFNMSGGNVLLNTGSTATSVETFQINDVAGSSFQMTGGTITLQNINSGGLSDFSICGLSGTNIVTGGSVVFGNTSTPANSTFNFTPFASTTLPNLRVSGPAASACTLKPITTGDIRLLSLYIEANKFFDISHNANAGDNRTLVLSSTFDGTHSFFDANTGASDYFIPRQSTVQILGTSTVKTKPSGKFYNLSPAASGQTTTMNTSMLVLNQCALQGGTFTSSGSPILLIQGATPFVFNAGSVISVYQITYNLSGGTQSIPAYDYSLVANSVLGGNSSTFSLTGNSTFMNFYANGDFGAYNNIIFNTQNHQFTVNGEFNAGFATTTVNFGSSIVYVGGIFGMDIGGNVNAQTSTISVNGNWSNLNSIPFNHGTSTVIFTGGNTSISYGTSTETFYNLVINKTTGNLTLNTHASVANQLTLTSGIIISASTRKLIFNNGATYSGGSAASHISGPAQRFGLGSFIFPIGKGGTYRPLGINPSGLITDAFLAEYFNATPNPTYLTTNKESSLQTISTCEYWNLTRPAGSASTPVTLYYGSGSCNTPFYTSFRVALWNGSQWTNQGSAVPTGDATSGTITSASSLSTVGYLTLSTTSIASNWVWDTSTAPGIQSGAGTWGIDAYWTPRGGAGTTLYPWPGAGNNAWFEGADGVYSITVSGNQLVDSLNFSNTGYTLNAGTLTLGTNAIMVAVGKTATIHSVLAGTNVKKNGTGVLRVGGLNTYTGSTNIEAGTWQLLVSQAIPNTSSVSLSGLLDLNGFNETIASLAGSGTVDNVSAGGTPLLTVGSIGGVVVFSGILKNTTGVLSITTQAPISWTLSGANDFSGTFTIGPLSQITLTNNLALGNTLGGTVMQGGDNALGATVLTLSSVSIAGENITMISAATGDLRNRMVAENGAVNYSGAITLSGDGLSQLFSMSPAVFQVNGSITGTLGTFGLRGDGIGHLYSSVSLGSAFFFKTDASSWNVYSAVNTSGNCRLSHGTLRLYGTNFIPPNLLLIGQGGAFSATLDLNGYNQSVSGITSTSGTLSRDILNNGATAATLTINNTSDYVYEYSISNGTNVTSLIKSGTAVQTLSGTSAYTGATTIQAGTLNVTGSLTSTPITIQSGGTLAGSGSTLGSIAHLNGGIIAPGNAGPGTLTTGTLSMNASSILSFELGTARDRININGNLTLDGLLQITNLSGFGAGTYTLINATGAIADNGLSIASAPTGYNYTIQVSGSNVNLVVTAFTSWVWDTSTAPGIQPGNGTWGVDAYWTQRGGTGTALYAWPGAGNSAYFEGADGTYTITISGTQSADSLVFSNSGYTLASGTLAKGNAFISVASGKTAIINTVISGTAISKVNTGALELNGLNTYTGKTSVLGGDLYVNSIANVSGGASALGAPTTVANGTIDMAANTNLYYTGPGISTDRVVNGIGNTVHIRHVGSGTLTKTGGLTSSNFDLTMRGVNNIVENGLIALGSGRLHKTDNNTLTLTNNANSFSGDLQILRGVVSVSSVANIGVASQIGAGAAIQLGQNVAAFGTLRFTGSSGGSMNRSISVVSDGTTSGGGVIENTVAGQQLSLSGAISASTAATLELTGAGNGLISGVIGGANLAVLKSGTGIWKFTGSNNYNGATTVNAGTLTINGTITSSSTIATGATLAGTGTVASLVVQNGGILAPGDNGAGLLSAGATTLNSSSILNFELGSASDRLAASGNLVLDGTINVTALSGFGAGTYIILTSSGSITNNGLTVGSVPPGYNYAVQVSGSNVNLVVTINSTNWVWDISTAPGIQPGNGTWGVDAFWTPRGGAGTQLFPWPGAGNNAWFEGADGTYTISISGTQSVDSITFSNAVYTISGAGIINKGVGVISVAAGKNAAINSVITGTSMIFKTGTGNLALSGANTFSGGFTHLAGDINVQNSAAFGTGPVTINGPGRFYMSNGINCANTLHVQSSNPGAGQGNLMVSTGTATWSGAININVNSASGGHWAILGTLNLTGPLNVAPGMTANHRLGLVRYGGGGSIGAGSNFGIHTSTVQLSANNGLPPNIDFYQYQNTTSTAFDMNGFSQTLSMINSVVTTGSHTINNASGTQSVLTLSGTQGVNGIYNGAITGNIALIKNGATTQTLAGTNTYTGTTTLNGGITSLSGSLTASAVTVNNSATLEGTGTISSSVSVAAGGILSPGIGGAGTLSTGALTLANTSALNFDLGAIGSSDRIAVSGNLILDGTLHLTAITGFQLGTHTIMTYTGTLTNNTLTIGTPIPGFNCVVQASGGNVNLVITGSITWDASAAAGLQPASGTWGINNYWTARSGPGTLLVNWPGAGNAYFEGANGTYNVTVDGTQNVDSIEFNNSGYTLSSGTLNFNLTNASITTNADASITGSVVALNNLFKNGNSNLIWNSGALTNSMLKLIVNAGTLTINSGTINLNGADGFGKSLTMNSNMVMNGGELNANNIVTLGFNLGASTVNTTITGGNTSGQELVIGWNTISNLSISGGTHTYSLAVKKRDSNAGTLTLSGTATMITPELKSQVNSNTDIFNVFISSGATLQTGRIFLALGGTAQTNVGPHNFFVESNGGTFVATNNALPLFDSVPSIGTSARNFEFRVNTGGVFVNSNGLTIRSYNPWRHLTTLGATLDGGLTKIGAGTLQFFRSNTYTGPTTITQGTIALKAAEVLENTSQVILNGGELSAEFNETCGSIIVQENSSIYLNSGTHTLSFAASNANSWTSGKLLTIYDWLGGYNGTSAGISNPKIFVGSSADLSAAKLLQIRFFRASNSTYYPAMQLSTGEIVPFMPRGGQIATSATVCSGSNSGILTLSNFDGVVLNWESSTDDFVTSTTIANTTNTLTYTNLTAATKYRAVVQYGTYPSVLSDTVLISINPATVGGTVSSSAFVCENVNAGTLTLSGHTGAILRWESSLDNFATAGNIIANTTTSLSYSNITTTTSYRAVLQSGVCPAANSSVAVITTESIPSAPTGTPGARCNVGAVNLSASGSPFGYRWYDASTGGTLLGSAATFTTPSISSSTTYYVASVTANGCESSTRTAVIANVNFFLDVSMVPLTGLVSMYYFNGDASDWSGNGNHGVLQNGPILGPDRFGNANVVYQLNGTNQYISTTTLYVDPQVFSIGMWFRTNTNQGGTLLTFANNQTGVATGSHDRKIYMSNDGRLHFGVYNMAPQIISTEGAYNDNEWHFVSASLSASGMKLYVDGFLENSNPAITTAEPYAGYWRIGAFDLGTWPNEPTSDFFAGSVDNTYIYNREISDAEVYRLYNNPFSAGFNNPVCSLGSNLNLVADTWTGATYSWSGPNGFSSSLQNPSIPAITAANLGVYTLLIDQGGCVATTKVLVRIYPASAGGTVSGATSVCTGTNGGTLTLSGKLGRVNGWEYSLDNFATSGVAVTNTTTSLSYSNLVATTSYRAVVQNGGCPVANSSVSTITVAPLSAAGAISGATSVCTGTNAGNLVLSGNTGGVTGWEYSLDNFATAGVPISNTTSTLAYLNLTQTTSYRAIVQSGACAPVTSASVTMTVNPNLPASVSIAADQNPICTGTNVTFTATPTNGGVTPTYQWKLNGTNVGTNATTYSNNSLTNGDVVTLEMTSNATCATGSPATSNAVTMTVNPNLPASVSIAADQNPICTGTNVTFTATPTNGGGTPTYQWKLNGTNVGTNATTYSNNSLTNGDVVTLEMTSNATCATGSPATSNAVTMTVNPNLPASV
ncbi:MAG: autotransporter-associated beta strand repeat-containing protein, partial [Cytophagaceae bacterium]|nr:autotransporter-associated beta strand repeat-containing protein [Cytophagaceae bacterium]